LDEPIPDYIEARKDKLKKLHEAGLRYPPSYEDIAFSDSECEEKPILSNAIKTQRAKRDIRLHESGAIVPAPIAQWLREYQVEGVQFLHERFVKQTGAILGDDMGLGKTIQVIAFLTAAFGKNGTKRDAKCMRKIRRYGDGRWYPRVMIICPGTLMRNWEDELEKWGWWQVYKYHGNPADRKGVLGAARKGMLEIMITTYDTYRNNEGEINTVDWDCVVADECHQIKNRAAEITKAMNRINALCRIGLTGTAIQNKYEELWNLLNWARPGAYGSAQEWKQMVSLPLKMGQAHDASFAQLANARSKAKELVEGILPSVFLRRMKTLIADQLPKKSDRVVFCQLTETQADAYREYIESDKCAFIRTAKEPCDCGSGKKRGWCCFVEVPNEGKWSKFMFPCMVSLQKLANHLALLLPISSDPNDKQAKDLENLQTACPENWRDMYRIRDSVLHQSQREFCGKWKVLKRLLDFWHSNGDKVLVFSHSVRLLRLLKSLFDLDGTKYNFSYLDGSMTYEDRAEVVADFNSNPSQFVFLISTRAGGVGLNITSANKVVVVDPNWNPAYDLQAQDRAYRIGQTRDVEVFRLVSSGTIEEIVYARQIYKQQQANIGYTASHERRYFKGVMDQSEKKGELFGLENLFTFQENNLLLRDVLHKTNVAETRAGVSALSCNFEDMQSYSDDDDDVLSNASLGIADDDISMESQIKKLAESFTSSSSSSSKKKLAKRAGPDPINAILAKAGVQYTHENSEVIGRSEIEAKLGEQAMELRNDVDLSRKRVFAASQSQSQSQAHRLDDDIRYSGDSGAEEDQEEDLKLVGISKGGGKEFKINYRYRPDDDVRRRQFCEMSRMWGYEDPVEFALLVEGMKQDERRKMLEKFYQARRRNIVGEFNGGH
jgi:superfamily II DNA or RNA helicase